MTTTSNTHVHRLLLAGALFTTVGLLCAQQAPAQSAQSPADKTVRLQEFEVIEPRPSAQTMAPTESRLEAVQPESIINLQTIQVHGCI